MKLVETERKFIGWASCGACIAAARACNERCRARAHLPAGAPILTRLGRVAWSSDDAKQLVLYPDGSIGWTDENAR